MFVAMFESSPVALILVDQNRRIVISNKQAELLFQYSKNELKDQPIEILIPMSARDRHPELANSYIKNPASRAMGQGRELFGLKKNGVEFPVEVGLNPILAPEGNFIMSSIVDITEQVKIRDKLMEQNDELQQFAYRTSHDLKSPLISIRGLAEFITEDLKNGHLEEAILNAAKIDKISKKLTELVDGIFHLAKSGNQIEPNVEINLPRLVQDSQFKVEKQIKQKSIHFEENYYHTLPLISQVTRVTQIIDNLISNAVKYTDPKKEKCTVSVMTTNDDHFFFIQIKDNGIGIPDEKKEEVFGLFKRFHQTDESGSGLGLYLIKKHVTKMKGSIAYESSALGTCFTVKLPLN